MKNFPNVSKEDCLILANFLNTLRTTTIPNAGLGQIVQFADGVRWLQDLAVALAKVYADIEAGKETPQAEGYKVKSIHPGGVDP